MADSHDPALKTLDDDVIATYEQLKVKFAAASNAQKRGDEQLKELEMKNRRSQLMLVNLSQLEPDTVTYKNVGKAYVMAPKSEIISDIEESFREGLETVKKRKGDKEAVDKSADSILAELREHLEANQTLAHAVMQSQGA